MGVADKTLLKLKKIATDTKCIQKHRPHIKAEYNGIALTLFVQNAFSIYIESKVVRAIVIIKDRESSFSNIMDKFVWESTSFHMVEE